MDFEKLTPKDKTDIDFIEELLKYDISEIKEIVPQLLCSIQDGNWPCADPMADYLSKYTNEIEEELFVIIRGKDDTWKYWAVFFLVLNSKVVPSKKLMEEMERLAYAPSKSEELEEVNEIALKAIDKYKPR